MRATKNTISKDDQKSEIQVEPDSDLITEPGNEASEETFNYSAPMRIVSSSMGACPSSSTNNNNHNNIVRLQQSYGNLATLQLLNQNFAVQPKLKISQPKDHCEQEADTIANLITGKGETEIQPQPG